MLPEGFHWCRTTLHDPVETVIAYRDVPVCRLMDRIDDGSWYVFLDYQRSPPPGRAWPRRACSSFEQGRVGCELWVARHQDRLREEARALADERDARRRF